MSTQRRRYEDSLGDSMEAPWAQQSQAKLTGRLKQIKPNVSNTVKKIKSDKNTDFLPEMKNAAFGNGAGAKSNL